MSATAGGSAQRLDIGQALQEVLGVLTRNVGPFALMGVCLAGLPVAAIDLGNALGAQKPVFLLFTLVGLIASFVTRAILAGAVIFRTARDMAGESTSVGESFAAGRRRWGAMLALMIVTGLLTGLGLLLLVVPGIYFALQWAVAGPALALSGRGSADAREESARLTQGRRWAMLLFYLIVIATLLCGIGLLIVVESALSLVAPSVLVTVLFDPLSNVLIDIVLPVAATVLYRRLREDADGAPTAALAEVFA
jgi:hypothetical protein